MVVFFKENDNLRGQIDTAIVLYKLFLTMIPSDWLFYLYLVLVLLLTKQKNVNRGQKEDIL